jgi:hypothetical protein
VNAVAYQSITLADVPFLLQTALSGGWGSNVASLEYDPGGIPEPSGGVPIVRLLFQREVAGEMSVPHPLDPAGDPFGQVIVVLELGIVASGYRTKTHTSWPAGTLQTVGGPEQRANWL